MGYQDVKEDMVEKRGLRVKRLNQAVKAFNDDSHDNHENEDDDHHDY